MTDAMKSYDFSDEAEAGRPRVRTGLVLFAILFAVLCGLGYAFREPLLEVAGSHLVPTPEPQINPEDVLPEGLSDDERLMYTITHAGGEAGKKAIEEIVARNDQKYVGVLLEALIAAENNPPGYPWLGHHHHYKGLMKLIGGPSMAPERLHQPLSQNFLIWYTAHDLHTPPGYTGWKGQLFARIDPAFGELIYEGVPTAVRMEEVRCVRSGFDAVPTLDDPTMIPADAATYLTPDEIVFGIELGGDARAYPERIVQWHTVVNDVVGKVPVTLAFCGFTGSAVALDGRASDGEIHTFGSAGMLYRSSQLLFDRESRTVWCPLTGKPLFGQGVRASVSLHQLPLATTTWQQWRSQHPETTVLAEMTGTDREYEPGAAYGLYNESVEPLHAFGPRDDRLPAKSRVFGLRIGDQARAYPIDALVSQKVVNDDLAGEPLVLVCTRGAIRLENTVSVYDFRGRERSRNLSYEAGADVRAFARQDRSFHIGDDPDTVLDENGRTWKITSRALVSEDGEELPRLGGVGAFWFAWSQHNVGTGIFTASPTTTAGTTP